MGRKRVISWGIGLIGAALAVGFSGAVAADESGPDAMSISFLPTTFVTGDPGSIHEIARSAVPLDMIGTTCSITVTADNNVSVHPQSDLILASGTSQVVVADVEPTPGAVTTGSGTMTLGGVVTVSAQLGPDGQFSGGGSVDLQCAAVSPVTTPTTPPSPAIQEVTVTQPAAAQAAAVEAAPSFTG